MSKYLFIAVIVMLLAATMACAPLEEPAATGNTTDNITDASVNNQTALEEPRPVPEDSMPRISIAEMKQKRDSGENILIVDTRHSEEYLVDHIKGAVSAPLDDIIAGKWQPPVNKELILYCG